MKNKLLTLLLIFLLISPNGKIAQGFDGLKEAAKQGWIYNFN